MEDAFSAQKRHKEKSFFLAPQSQTIGDKLSSLNVQSNCQ